MTANHYHPKSDKGLQVTTLCKEMPEASKAVGSQEFVLGMCMCVHVCVCKLCVYAHVCACYVCVYVWGWGVCVGRCTYLYAPMCPGTYVHVYTHMWKSNYLVFEAGPLLWNQELIFWAWLADQ